MDWKRGRVKSPSLEEHGHSQSKAATNFNYNKDVGVSRKEELQFHHQSEFSVYE
jgi:hypothetical protein